MHSKRFEVGDKVLCIEFGWGWSGGTNFPLKEGEIYTVCGYHKHFSSRSFDGYTGPTLAVLLEEEVNPDNPRWGFNQDRFILINTMIDEPNDDDLV